MQLLKNIGVGILAFFACVHIGWFGEVEQDVPEKEHYLYMGMMVGSVAFLHWVLLSYLVPMKRYPANVRKRISEGIKRQYHVSFFNGTIGFGYLLTAVGVFQFLRLPSSDFNYFLGALFFIALGVFSKARGVTDMLIRDMQKNQDDLTRGST